MPMSVVSYLIMSLSGMKIVSKGKYQESDLDNKFTQPDERVESIVDVVKLLKT